MKKAYKKWTLETCLQDALKYKTISEWRAKSPNAYKAAAYHGWLPKCTKHMTRLKHRNGYWTYARLDKISKKFKSRYEWQQKSTSSYMIAHRNGWLNELCAHME